MQPASQKLIEACKTGDAKAQKALFETLYAPMYRVCLRYLNHKEDAEDCLMKGLLKAFQNIGSFRYNGEGSLESWMRKILVNECLMTLRKKSNLLFYPEEEPAHCFLPADVLMKLDAEEIASLVRQLPVGYRTVFNLFVVEGYSHNEIGVMLNITESTSKSQYSKARLKLKQFIEKNTVSYGKLGK